MPLQDHFPVIDDRRFRDIVEEAKARVPRYTPEWTDLNPSDPGMTLVDLFAWMTELLIYRLGKVPKLNYLKFLELIGLELEPARAAVAEITFPLQASFTEPYVIVPRLTQVATDVPDETGPVIFETERSLIALTARLDAVLAHDGYAFRDVTGANEQAEGGFEPFGPRATEGSALYLGLRSGPEFPRVEVDLAFWAKPGRETGGGVTCGAGPRLAEATLAWEYWDGHGWSLLDLLDDQTGALKRTGHVRLQAPPAGRMKRRALASLPDPRFWIRARILASAYQVPPRLLAVRTNTATATQAQTVEFEVLGESDGRPDQVFALTGRPVLDGSLVLEVDEGEGFQAWKEVEDLYASSPDDTHYVLNRATAEVRLGDGTRARIPVANLSRPGNIRARVYRYGGGRRGTAAAKKISVLMSGIAGVDAGAVGNLFPSGGGADEETLEEARKRAPASLKSRTRAVTPEDFEILATQAGDVRRARALPLHHPGFPGVDIPGVVSVVVVPEPRDENDAAPLPTESTLRRVCACLDEHRLLTTEVFVIPPRYRRIQVRAELVAQDGADLADVKRRALGGVVRYFDPLTGGEDAPEDEPEASDRAPGEAAGGTGWPFGGDVYYSLVTRRLLVLGVQRVASLTLLVEGEACPVCSDVALEPDELVAGGPHEIAVRYAEADS